MGNLKTKAQSILTEKNNKIIPENIKEGVKIYNVTGTFAGTGKLNIYTQTTEPTKKDGLWLKTNTISSPTIIDDEHIYASEEWNTDKTSNLQSIPNQYYNNFKGGVISIGTDIYLIGICSALDTYAIYKYNSLNDTYTNICTLPMSIALGSAVGTDIFLFQGKKVYKYNTLTDTLTTLDDAPYEHLDGNRGQCISIGTNIYLLGGFIASSAPQYYLMYKYDTINRTFTSLPQGPVFYDGVAAVAVENDLYLFGGQGYNGNGANRAYKYNVITGNYTRLTDIPYSFVSGSAILVDSDILLIGGSQSGTNKYTYKYNILTNTYTRLSDTIYSFASNKSTTMVNQDIYLFYYTNVQVMTAKPKTYTNNSIVIANNKTNKYSTQLIDTNVTNGLKYHFDNFWYATTDDNETTFDTTIEKYYGNGTSWIQIV